MIPLMRLKKDVEFNRDLTYVIEALKGIALNRYYALQRELAFYDQFADVAQAILSGVELSSLDHPYARQKIQRTSVVVITSDGGFLGGLNSRVVTMAASEAGPDGLLSVVGVKGASALREMKREVTPFRGLAKDDVALAREIRDHLVKQVMSGEAGRIVIVYPHPVSLSTQKVTAEKLVPCDEWLVNKKKESVNPEQMIWESTPEVILQYSVHQWIEYRLLELFTLSRLSEMAARVMHLEGSYQELIRQGKKIKLQYHRARHEVIDRSMREVFSSQLLMGRKKLEELAKMGLA